MSFVHHDWQNPLYFANGVRLWVNASGVLRYYNDVVTSDTDGTPLILADGTVAMEGDFDLDGNSILNLLGLGGADGKAIRFCSTAAEIIAACEDADVQWVYILEGHYDIDDTIDMTSHKKVVGIGDVELDWTGAAATDMINDPGSLTHLWLENLTFVKNGNTYYVNVGDYATLIDIDFSALTLNYAVGFSLNRMHCRNVKFQSASISGKPSNGYFEGCTFYDDIYFRWGAFHDTVFVNCDIISVGFGQNGGGAQEVSTDIIFDHCHFYRPYSGSTLVTFGHGGTPTGTHTYKRIKFSHCDFYAGASGGSEALLINSQWVAVEDLIFENCWLYNLQDGFLISNGTLTRMRVTGCTIYSCTDAYDISGGTQTDCFFSGNKYPSVTNKFNVTGGTQTDWVIDEHVRQATAVSATVLGEADIIAVTNTGAARTVTFPSWLIAACPGKIWTVKDESGGAGTNNITVATAGAETIDNAASVKIATDFGVIWLYSDGSNLFTVTGLRYGRLYISAPEMDAFNGATAATSKGYHPAIDMDAGGETVNFGFQVPDNFAALVSANVVYVANTSPAGTDGFDIYTEWGAAGEVYNADSDNLLDADTGAKTVGIIYELDISDALTGISAGDNVGVWMLADNSGANPVDVSILRFEFVYIKTG